jgi:hypothetical protein
LRVVSNFEGAIPWSKETMLEEFARADIVVIPTTASYKSANRAIEAIRQGCFVVAEPHPALEGFPDLHRQHQRGHRMDKTTEHERTHIGGAEFREGKNSTPQILIDKWKSATKRPTTLDADKRNGTVG